VDSNPIARLCQTAKTLPAELRAEVLALGARAVPDIVALLDDNTASLEGSPGDGWPPIHAVELLAEMKALEAIEPMLRALVRTDWMSILHDRIIHWLPEFGAPVLEPGLALLDKAQDQESRRSLCAVLAKLGVRDDRLYRALCQAFEESPTSGATLFYDYGDPAALPQLQRAIECFKPNFDNIFYSSDLTELVEAFRELGGILPDAVQARVDEWEARWDAQRKALFEPMKQPGRRKVGRNEPCPCGSGKKYKKCHLDAELPS